MITVHCTNKTESALREQFVKHLIAYNDQNSSPTKNQPVTVLAEMNHTGQILGGLWGRTCWQWLLIEFVYLLPEYRNLGLGTKLIQTAEAEALKRGCQQSYVDTFSFQAPFFYRRLGYDISGSISNFPEGHQRHFMTKPLEFITNAAGPSCKRITR